MLGTITARSTYHLHRRVVSPIVADSLVLDDLLTESNVPVGGGSPTPTEVRRVTNTNGWKTIRCVVKITGDPLARVDLEPLEFADLDGTSKLTSLEQSTGLLGNNQAFDVLTNGARLLFRVNMITGSPSAVEVYVAGGAVAGTYIPEVDALAESDVFVADLDKSSTSFLDTRLVINDQGVDQFFRYDGYAASGTTWNKTVGEDLAEAGAGDSPTYDNGSPTGVGGGLDSSVGYSAQKYHIANNTAFGEIGGDDFVIEALIYNGGASSKVFFGKTSTDYWRLQTNAAGTTLQFVMDGGGGLVVASAAIPLNCWAYVIVFADISGSIILYVNAQTTAGAAVVSGTGDVDTSSANFAIGANSDGGVGLDGAVAYCAGWKAPNWLDTHEQIAVAEERFSRLNGTYGFVAAGDPVPILVTRSSVGYIDKWEDGQLRLYQVADHWPRLCGRFDENLDYLEGYLAERAETNLIPDCCDLAAWSVGAGASASATAQECPDRKVRTTVTLFEDGSNGVHWLNQPVGTLTSGQHYVWSGFVRAVNRDDFAVLITGAGTTVQINIDLPTLTTNYAPLGPIDDWQAFDAGGGWKFIEVMFTPDGTGSAIARLYSAAGGFEVYQGANQDAIQACFIQVEQTTGTEYATSRIFTSGGSAARSEDRLDYEAGLNIGDWAAREGVLTAKVLNRIAQSPTYGSVASLLDASNGILNRIDVLSNPTTGLARGSTATLVGGATADITSIGGELKTNTIRTVKFSWGVDDVELFVDGESEGTDTDSKMPVDIDVLQVGYRDVTVVQPNGLISGLTIRAPKLPTTTLLAEFNKSGNRFLSEDFTIAGVTKKPTLLYRMEDNSDGSLIATYGVDLPEAGTGDSPLYNQRTPFVGGGSDRATRYATGQKFHQSPDTTTGEITGEDFVIEMIVKIGDAASIIDKRGTIDGWMVQVPVSPANTLNLFVDDGTLQDSLATSTLTKGALYHAVVIVDRDGSGRWYVNGKADNQLAMTVGDLDKGVPLRIGSNNFTTYNGDVLYLAMWMGTDWVDDATNKEDLVAERFYKLAGAYPEIARGTPLPTVTRADAAYLDKIEDDGTTGLYLVGENWPRVCSRKSVSDVYMAGLLSENAQTNSLINNLALDSGWSAFGSPTVTDAAAIAPDGTLTAVRFENVKSGHGRFYATTGHVIDEDMAPGIWLQRISVSGTARIYEPHSSGDGDWHVDLSDADLDEWVFITRSSPYVTVIEEFTADTSGQCGMAIAATGAVDTDFLVWAPTLHPGVECTSVILTEGTPAARAADIIRYVGDDGNVTDNGEGTVTCTVLSPDALQPGNLRASQFTDGGSGLETFAFVATASAGGGAMYLEIIEGGVSQAVDVGGVVANGEVHDLEYRWSVGFAEVGVDGVRSGSPDTPAAIPNDQDRVDVGSINGSSSLNGLIANFRIENRKAA